MFAVQIFCENLVSVPTFSSRIYQGIYIAHHTTRVTTDAIAGATQAAI